MQTIEEKNKEGGFLNDSKFRKEWEKIRARTEHSKRTSKKKWLTAIIDIKTRIIIHYIITDSRPNNKSIYKLVKTAIVVTGFPTDIITDCYPAYKPAMNRIANDTKNHVKNGTKHRGPLHVHHVNASMSVSCNFIQRRMWSDEIIIYDVIVDNAI